MCLHVEAKGVGVCVRTVALHQVAVVDVLLRVVGDQGVEGLDLIHLEVTHMLAQTHGITAPSVVLCGAAGSPVRGAGPCGTCTTAGCPFALPGRRSAGGGDDESTVRTQRYTTPQERHEAPRSRPSGATGRQ